MGPPQTAGIDPKDNPEESQEPPQPQEIRTWTPKTSAERSKRPHGPPRPQSMDSKDNPGASQEAQ